ncbi:MAG: carboxylesterase family protein [Dehalococcoidales bacterium]|nr:carboxylesterase family protein [Dehalococcoidales bacterium]
MQLVKTDKGYVSGTVIGEPGKEASIFRGIPYAAPPVGDLRWKPPQPVEPWEGIRECTQMSKISPQFEPPGMVSGFTLGEDCLYLNVVTPAKEPGEKLPVLVWMHGGGYSMGCGNDKVWNNYRLPQHGAVVVTLTHRLGPIGLLAHPALSKESPAGVSGNYLFLDLIESLKWIQNNIAAFGGDPDNVTIFGESGGGAKVSIMMSSPMAKGLFHRAICESGTSLAILGSAPLADIESNGEKLFNRLGIDSSDPLEQVRALPWEKIIEASQAMEPPRTPGQPPAFMWDGSIDGWLIPDSPVELFKSGNFNAVPLIVTANLGELIGPGGPLLMPQIVPAYVDMMNAVTQKGSNGYAMIFDQVPAAWRKHGFVSIHSIELTYVFGDWDNSTGWWNSIAMMAAQAGAKTSEKFLDETDKYVSETMMELWANFARDGKPSAESVPEWPEYTDDTDRYMNVNEKFEVKDGYSKVAQ